MKPATILIAALGLGAVGAVTYSALQPSDQEKFLSECEEIIQDRLRSPATYARIEVSPERRERATFEQFMGIDTPEKIKMNMANQAADARVREIFEERKKLYSWSGFEHVYVMLTYDAANAYGTPIRDTSICGQIVETGAPLKTDGFTNTEVDGFDKLGWLTYQLWKARTSN